MVECASYRRDTGAHRHLAPGSGAAPLVKACRLVQKAHRGTPIERIAREIFSAVTVGTEVFAIYLAAIIFAVLRIYRRTDLNESEKLVWIVAGPHPFGFRITRDLPRQPREGVDCVSFIGRVPPSQ